MKRSNIRIIGVPEEEDKKKDHEKILEEIIVENFPKMGKEIITQVQETRRVPSTPYCRSGQGAERCRSDLPRYRALP